MKKILLPILALALVCMTSHFSFAERTLQTCIATADFNDFTPRLIHNEPRVKEVISCNMVLKPRTQAHLSRLCGSAVGNVMYYFNNSTSDVQKGPDYTNVVSDENFYPATRLINNSYIGGTISYKVSCDFQTKKSNGEKVYLEVPTRYQKAEIISSKTLYLDMGEEYTLYQETGDQSQNDWVGVKEAIPALSGTWMDCVFRFGSVPSSASGAFGLLKVKLKNVGVLDGVCYTYPSLTVEQAQLVPNWTVIDGVVYENSFQPTQLNEDDMAICQKAKKLIMQYNLDPGACNDKNEILKSEGWADTDGNYKPYVEGDTLYYPKLANAWGRIIAVLEVPSADDCKPVRRTIVKGRIGVKYPGFEFKNMKEGDVLKIYNVNGKKIREITSGTAEGFVWDGRNDSGDWAKSGIYIYQIKVDGKLISGTIAFVY